VDRDDAAIPLRRGSHGYHHAEVGGLAPGDRYSLRLDGGPGLPDPASRYQPEGVHGPSAVVDPGSFTWTDAGWPGPSQSKLVLYELHVGTFTEEGSFDAIIPHIAELRDLGVTAIELMPVAQFPGRRNWGYDGVLPFAVQHSYGGPEGLRRLVDACHAQGMAVLLDVVFNHLGPEGNYLPAFGPYLTARATTPWGQALNFDGPASDEVRRFFIESVVHWVEEYHLDGFRLDAIHAINDVSARPFLEEVTATVHDLGDRLDRRVVVIAESIMNDPRVITPAIVGGFGMDAEWCDDFHHALHVELTGETGGYYDDFTGFLDLVRAFRQGFVFTGRHSLYRGRRHGSLPRLYQGRNLVVFAQNHDQIGNRAQGDRLTTQLSFEQRKLAAGVVCLSPYLPMLFMGEEYSETAPFQFFVEHGNPGLIEAVRIGRRADFASFHWQGEIPDPQDERTFLRSKLDHALRETPDGAALWRFYQELLRLRRDVPALASLTPETMEVLPYYPQRIMAVQRWTPLEDDEVVTIFSFSPDPQAVTLPLARGEWEVVLDSADSSWLDSGADTPSQVESSGDVALTVAPWSVVVFRRNSGGGA
jgi:maltooligosyltrehalose trehalohydrolase